MNPIEHQIDFMEVMDHRIAAILIVFAFFLCMGVFLTRKKVELKLNGTKLNGTKLNGIHSPNNMRNFSNNQKKN